MYQTGTADLFKTLRMIHMREPFLLFFGNNAAMAYFYSKFVMKYGE